MHCGEAGMIPRGRCRANQMNDVAASRSDSPQLDFLAKGGEMGARMRALDWSATPLGHPGQWPQSLKTIVRMMLDSRYAMWMAWGPALTFFCNDAYLPTVGIKRDWVLGARSDEVWKEIWPDVGPRIESVLNNAEATWDEGLLLFLERSGFPEETYHTFSYSPLYDDRNRVTGMLCVVTEVTERVIGERRLRALSDLASLTGALENLDETCRRAISVLSRYPLDVPFAVLYLVEAERGHLRRVAATRELGDEQMPASLSFTAPAGPWPVGELLQNGAKLHLKNLPARGVAIESGPWPDLVQQALVLPLSSASQGLTGCLVAGLTPRRAFDPSYADFMDLLAGQIASAVSDAQAYQAERARAEALTEIDRAKTAFFSNVSHEFRTPLTLMMSPLEEVLRSDSAGLAAPVRHELEIVHRNGLRLLRLVNTLLDFSRIEAGRMHAHYERTDVGTLTAELASTFHSTVERAGLHFDMDCAPLADEVYVDRDMWEKIVLNLVSNAFKYTLEGGIRICVRRSPAQVNLVVADTGTGIPPESLPHLFERFYRVPEARGRTYEGTGIGLALVHELVMLHGGTIHVQSEMGVGSAFTVALPLGRGHLPQDQIATGTSIRPERARASRTMTDAFVEEASRWEPRAAPAQALAAGDEVNPAQITGTVLLVDDNADMREYVRGLLHTSFRVITAGDGVMALEAVRALDGPLPDVVLSDVMMPRLDGVGLLRALRADPRTRGIPVILLSARAGEEARIEGLEAGADDYLIKPFTARELLARVSSHASLARLRQQAQRALEESNRRKDEFLAMLAHELRNPLAPIQNASELLSRRLPDDIATQALASMVKRQVTQLTRLVDDLLDVSRITEGRIELQRQPLELSSVINQAVESVEPLVQAKQHRIRITSSHKPIYVSGDVARLVQCVANVLTNAAKYTDHGGAITVELRSQETAAVIEVTDNGVGISADLLPHVFDLFVQGDRTLDRSQGGLGIGLSIVQRLIQLHDGQVTAASAGAGCGATFQIRLPLIERPAVPENDQVRAKPASKRVLIVDDNVDAADSLQLLLGIDGHETRTVYSAKEALELAPTFRPNLVLLDIGLPEMDGYEVARRLRALDGSAHLVALTGYGQTEDKRRAAEAGFNAHLLKPLDFASLERILGTL